MMHLTRSTFALAFAVVLPFSSLTGQSSAPLASDAAAALIAPDPTEISKLLIQAEELRAQGRFAESLAEYQEIARMQSESFENAARTYWTMAEIHNALGDDRGMARVLDAAADHAGRFGDHDTRARALFEAAVAYAKIRDQGAANERMDMLRSLMDTQSVSEELRRTFEMRAGQSF